MQVTERTSFFLEAGTDGNGHARNVSPWRGRCKWRPGLPQYADSVSIIIVEIKRRPANPFVSEVLEL